MNSRQLKDALEEYRRRSDFIRRATSDTIIGESTQQQEVRIKQLLLPKNYGQMFNYYFGKDTPIPMADSDCAKFHIDTYVELFNMPIITQQRRWSRSFAKSVHSNVGNPFGLKQNKLCKFYVIVGINEDRAKLLLSDLQLQLEANQRIIKDFGEQKVYGSWMDGEFETTDGCYFLALGIDQPFRGLRRFASRVDYACVDDCEDRKVAKNEGLVRERGEKILSDLRPAFGKNSKRLVIANNFIEDKGLCAYIHNKMKDSKYTRTSHINWVDKDGHSMWPERFSDAEAKIVIDDTDPITFSREYMQIPVTEGALFKPHWIVHKKTLPLHEYKIVLGNWDLSYTATGDYKAFALVGATDREIHVLDVFCRKCDLTEATDYHFNLVKRLKNLGTLSSNAKSAKYIKSTGITPIFFYDATAAQEAVFKEVFWLEAAKHKCYEIPLPEHATVDKHLRIEATLVNLFFNRRLYFADYLVDSPDFKIAKEQLLVFEKGSKAHDDFPDTLEAACRKVQQYTYPEESNFTPIIKQHKRGGY